MKPYRIVEYKVRPVTRYIVTRYIEEGRVEAKATCSSSVLFEAENEDWANRIADGLTRLEGIET